MSYTFEQLKEDVRKEAEALRVHATKEELSKLDFFNLKPRREDCCIYGQMCGSCHSIRAVDLIQKSTPRFFKDQGFTSIIYDGFEGVQKRVNGETVENFIEDRTNLKVGHYSAIEAYILLPEAKNANLIAYLRGETDTLTL
jgi:hypothetical protein